MVGGYSNSTLYSITSRVIGLLNLFYTDYYSTLEQIIIWIEQRPVEIRMNAEELPR